MNLRAFLDWFVYQQDYLWLLVTLGGLALGVAWWRSGRSLPMLAWIPWVTVGGVLTAAIQLSQLVTPVVQQPFVAQRLSWDTALTVAQALLAAGLAWTLLHGKKVLPLVTARFLLLCVPVAAAYWHFRRPTEGSVALALVVCLPAVAWVRRSTTTRTGRLALLAVVMASLLATNGPLAEKFGYSHRYSELSPYGLWAALGLLGATIAAGRVLYLQTVSAAPARELRADLNGLIRAQGVWLVLGLGLATIMSYWARSSFEQNLLSRSRMAAELIDKRALEQKLGPAFRVDRTYTEEFQDTSIPSYYSTFLTQDPFRVVKDNLAAIEVANPDVDWALVMTVRDGLAVQLPMSSRMPKPPVAGTSSHRGRVDPAAWEAWSQHRSEVFAPLTTYYGTIIQVRVALVTASQRMLGWLILDANVSLWLAAQIQARLLAFVVIALGSVLLAVNWQQRLRERTHAIAQREADAAVAANRMKAAFLAKVSHELRTPIQSLLGYSELLRQRVVDDAKAAGWLANLQQHGELMTRLVNDLIDLGAVEAGAFQLSPRTVDPASLVSQTVESFRPRAESRQLMLACFIEPGVPEWVTLDGERFRQVLTNLLGNALKFTARGGVTVSLRPEATNRLVLAVRDTGPGIPPAEQAKIFVAFSRLESTSDQEGTGLGLALSAALCQAMGGKLDVASDGIAGSCFTATFRAEIAAGPVETETSQPPATLRGRRILVIDDNPLVRELFIAFLTEQGAMCAAASSGTDALAQVSTGEFDAIVLDLALPDGDGTEFVAPLKRVAPRARFVGVSAHASAADRQRALAAGMDVFLTKPVPLDALGRAVGDPANSVKSAGGFRTADALRERLARQFVRDLPNQRANLVEAIAARDWGRVCVLAHHMKNSAVVVRDDALFDACTGLEQAAADADEKVAGLWAARCDVHFTRWTQSVPSPFSPPAA